MTTDYNKKNTNFSMYGRAWRISVTFKNTNEALVLSDSFKEGDNALHCTFNCESSIMTPVAGDISIYNLDKETSDKIVESGDEVIVEAGYINGVFGVIWRAPIYQYLRTRENVVDWKLTLHSLRNWDIVTDNFVNTSLNAGMDFRTIVKEAGRRATVQVDVDGSVDKLEKDGLNKKFPRGRTIFRPYWSVVRDVGRDCELNPWINENNKLSYSDLINSVSEEEEIVINQENGLIGTPVQTSLGCNFRCLLDPRITYRDPPKKVRLENTAIAPMTIMIGALPPNPIDLFGRYKIVAVNFVGDTRGSDWYCDVTCWLKTENMVLEGLSALNSLGGDVTLGFR